MTRYRHEGLGPIGRAIAGMAVGLTLLVFASGAEARIRLEGIDDRGQERIAEVLDVKLKVGEEVSLTLHADDLRGLEAGDFSLAYDRRLLSLQSITLDAALQNAGLLQPFDPRLDAPGLVTGGVSYLDALGDGFKNASIVRIKFRVIGDVSHAMQDALVRDEYMGKSNDRRIEIVRSSFVINEEDDPEGFAIVRTSLLAVPEPDSWVLIVVGLTTLAFVRLRA